VSTRTLVTVATYNEMENLPSLVDEIFRHAPDVDILVIDDHSPDGTGDWAAKRADDDPRVHVLRRPGKLGLGTATISGMQYAIDRGYDFVLNLDADFSHHPRYIPALREGMEHVDVMIGSRYVLGGGTPDWPLRRRAMSRGVNVLARWLMRLSPRDCSGAFRCYRVELLKRLDFTAIRSQGYSFQEEILWHLKRLGARFGETPIVFTDRQRGQSKINAGEAWSALRILFRFGAKTWCGV
jgi:dolichol-phosphate mannosyltransferase